MSLIAGARPGMIFVAPWFRDGGIERIFEIKAPWFAARGYPVEIRCAHIEHELAGRPNAMLASLAQSRIRVRRLPAYGSRLHLFQRASRLAAIALQGGFRILVGHEFMANLEVILAKRLLRGRVRAIVEVHNSIMYPDTGIDPAAHRRARRLFQDADGIVAMSDGVAADTADFFQVDRGRIATIPNPFRLAAIRRLAAEAPLFDVGAAGRYVVGCGRFVKMKGFSTLIRAFAMVRRVLPLKLVLLGDGPLRSELAACAKEAGVDADVMMPGWLPNPFPVFARAAMFVLSSIYGESFSRVLVEAMTCRVPVISSRCRYGPEEVLGGGAYGLLYEPGDVEGCADAMLSVLRRPADAARRVAAAARRVEDFEADRVLPQLEAYYTSGLAPAAPLLVA